MFSFLIYSKNNNEDETFENKKQLNEALENLVSDVSDSNSKEIHTIDCYFNSDEIDTEDGGQAKIFTVSKDDLDDGMFVRVCSWDKNKNHEDFKKFVGRRIKITIETIDISDVSGRYSLEEAKKFAMEKFNAEKTKSKYPQGGWIRIDDILSVLEVGVECGYKFGQKSNDH